MARTTMITMSFEVRCYEQPDMFFIKQRDDEYGVLVTDASAAQFKQIMQRFRYSERKDEAIKQFYLGAVAQLERDGDMLRPLN